MLSSSLIAFRVVFFLVGAPLAITVQFAGKAPPQSVPFILSLLTRKIAVPLVAS